MSGVNAMTGVSAEYYASASLDPSDHGVCTFDVADEILERLRRDDQVVLVRQATDPAETTQRLEEALSRRLGYPVRVICLLGLPPRWEPATVH